MGDDGIQGGVGGNIPQGGNPTSGTAHSFANMLNEDIRAYAPRKHVKKSPWEMLPAHADHMKQSEHERVMEQFLKRHSKS